MRPFRGLEFRTIVALLLVAAAATSSAIVGTTILVLKVRSIDAQNRSAVEAAARSMVRRTETMLDSMAGKLSIIANAAPFIPVETLDRMARDAVGSGAETNAVYVLDRSGKAVALGLGPGRESRRAEIIGNDFSNNPLFRGLGADGSVLWSDKYVSGVTDGTTVGVGVRGRGWTAIAEAPLTFILDTLRLAADAGELAVLVMDGRGEVVADSAGLFKAGVDNLSVSPDVRAVMAAGGGTGIARLAGRDYRVAVAGSVRLGWTFIARVPVGLASVMARSTVLDILALFAGTLLLGFAATPLLSRVLSSTLRQLGLQASSIARHVYGVQPVATRIREFRELSRDMATMENAIRIREAAYVSLNAELEQRVQERTRDLEAANTEARAANETLRLAQSELIRSEKLAALGKLVAGVAHELNTPIGNGLMAVSALKGERAEIEGKLQTGMSRAELAGFLSHVEEGLLIAERNLARAAQLVQSFKQVAVDQASAQRRGFDLAEIIDEILLTLKPSLKRQPYLIESSVPQGIVMDSYPGLIGQIITNLVNNAVLHAFDGRDTGTVRIGATVTESGSVLLSVADNGVGIPEANRDRIFEPFFTTKMGRGGTGLGLNIAHTAAREVLGGSMDFATETGVGTTFTILMPTVAPRKAAEDGGKAQPA
jgi:signal transduction histidine kinase